MIIFKVLVIKVLFDSKYLEGYFLTYSFQISKQTSLKLSYDSRFQRAFIACVCIFKVTTRLWTNQDNYFENATACSKRTLKTTVATQFCITKILKSRMSHGGSEKCQKCVTYYLNGTLMTMVKNSVYKNTFDKKISLPILSN